MIWIFLNVKNTFCGIKCLQIFAFPFWKEKKYKTLIPVDLKRYGNLQIQKQQNLKTLSKLKIITEPDQCISY